MIMNKVILGDCSVQMKKIPIDSINLVLTDPPYPGKDCGYEFENLRRTCTNEAPCEYHWQALKGLNSSI